MTEDKKETIISIRGLDRDLYRRLKAFADEAGKTVGEAVNEAIKLLLTITGKISVTVDEVVSEASSIRGFDELKITGEEIKKYGKKIILADIKTLYLENIDDEALDKIFKLVNIGKLIVSGEVNKVSLYTKCFNVSKVEFKEGS